MISLLSSRNSSVPARLSHSKSTISVVTGIAPAVAWPETGSRLKPTPSRAEPLRRLASEPAYPVTIAPALRELAAAVDRREGQSLI